MTGPENYSAAEHHLGQGDPLTACAHGLLAVAAALALPAVLAAEGGVQLVPDPTDEWLKQIL